MHNNYLWRVVDRCDQTIGRTDARRLRDADTFLTDDSTGMKRWGLAEREGKAGQ